MAPERRSCPFFVTFGEYVEATDHERDRLQKRLRKGVQKEEQD